MSEHQYYGFLATDKPLTSKQIEKVDSISSRAIVTDRSWKNEYNYGDFRGSVDNMMTMYDCHFYKANWGTQIFMISLPADVIDLKLMKKFQREDYLEVRKHKNHIFISWEIHSEEGVGWVEDEDELEALAPIREEIIRGDYRSLMIGSVACLEYFEDGDDENDNFHKNILITGDMKKLTSAQKNLVDIFAIDKDYVKALSTLADSSKNELTIEERIKGLSKTVMSTMLLKVSQGASREVERELLMNDEPVEFAEIASQELFEAKEKQTAVRLSREKKGKDKQQKKEAKLREKELTLIYDNKAKCWDDAQSLLGRPSASSYDKVTQKITDLFDAYAFNNNISGFKKKLAKFKNQMGSRPTLRERLSVIENKS